MAVRQCPGKLVRCAHFAKFPDPTFTASQELPEFRYAAYAESLGLKGIRLDKPENIVSAWREALAADRPVVIDALTDPEVPPLPPYITLTQARHFMGSLVSDPARGHLLRQSLKDMVENFVPHHSARQVLDPARRRPLRGFFVQKCSRRLP